MKLKNKYILLALFGGLSLTSCDDFLDIDYPSEQDPTLTFSNAEDAATAINGCYVNFCEDPFTSRMSNVWMQNTDVETQAPSAGLPSGSHRSDLWGLQSASDASFGDIYKAWNNCMETVELANNVIEGIQNSSAKGEAEMKQILGEAVCLKAWRYLMLCNFWGDVPFYNESSAWGQVLDKPRTDKNYIFSGCLQQLCDVEPGMKFSDVCTGGIERMNRDFCMGLIAKMALFRAGYGMTKDGTMKRADDYMNVASDDSLAVTYVDNSGNTVVARTSQDYYQMAKNYCQKLVSLKGRSLGTDFALPFNNEVERTSKANGEVLYEVAFLETKGGDVGWCIGVTNTNSTSSGKGSTTSQVGINPMYYMSFADNDQRRDVTCARYMHDNDTIKVIGGATAMGVGKWDRFNCPAELGGGSSKGTGINWPLMRYSEVLLMLAEAENELNGPTELAKDQLRKVRARAFANSPTYNEDVNDYVNRVASSKQDFFNAIVDERAWEFGGECIRKWDLQRWNIYGDKINDNLRQQIAWGIAMSPDLMEQCPEVMNQYPEYVNYMNCADKLYYKKPAATKRASDLMWYNNKYAVPADMETEKLDSVSWGNKILKSTTVYLYGGKEYTDKPLKNTAADGTVTYTFKDGVVVTATKDDDGGTVSGIVKRVKYESSDYASRIYRGYTGDEGRGTGAVPYVMPIGVTTISTSNVLSNDGYCFGYAGEGKCVTLGTIETPYK